MLIRSYNICIRPEWILLCEKRNACGFRVLSCGAKSRYKNSWRKTNWSQWLSLTMLTCHGVGQLLEFHSQLTSFSYHWVARSTEESSTAQCTRNLFQCDCRAYCTKIDQLVSSAVLNRTGKSRVAVSNAEITMAIQVGRIGVARIFDWGVL